MHEALVPVTAFNEVELMSWFQRAVLELGEEVVHSGFKVSQVGHHESHLGFKVLQICLQECK